MDKCKCNERPDLKCEWESSTYVFYFSNWHVELHVPFKTITQNMTEAFIFNLIEICFHERFCSSSKPLPESKFLFFLELCECLVDVRECLHVLFRTEATSAQEIPEEAQEIRVTTVPRKPSY